jgi:hypothetical protein
MAPYRRKAQRPRFYAKNQRLADSAQEILQREQPITLRGLFYRLISAGMQVNTPAEYDRLGDVMTRLREDGDVPMKWIVDHVRIRLSKPAWSGLEDFGESVRQSYRKDFWASLPHHVEVFAEKNALAATL